MKRGAGHGKSRETRGALRGAPELEQLVKHPKAFHRASLQTHSGSHASRTALRRQAPHAPLLLSGPRPACRAPGVPVGPG